MWQSELCTCGSLQLIAAAWAEYQCEVATSTQTAFGYAAKLCRLASSDSDYVDDVDDVGTEG